MSGAPGRAAGPLTLANWIALLACLLLAAAFVALSVYQFRKLGVIGMTVGQCDMTQGVIVDVQRRIDGDDHGGPDVAVAQIVFRYDRNGARTSNMMSPPCDYCPYDEVVRVTGKPPSLLTIGAPVPVYVAKHDDALAFLGLSTPAAISTQRLRVLLSLVPALIFVGIFARVGWAFSGARRGA